MKYGLYVKIFENKQKQKDLRMIYTEDFEWIRMRDKAKKYFSLLQFSFQLDVFLLCLALISACAMIVYPEITILKYLTLTLSATIFAICIIFNSIVLLKYNRYKNWQKEYESTFEYLKQMSEIIERGEKKNDL